jgi:hypothetical protein
MILAIAWKWQRIERVRLPLRILAAATLILIVGVVGYLKIAKTYQNEHKSPDDLSVTFSFPDRTQIRKGAIDFNTTFFNAGRRSAQIEKIGAFLIALTELNDRQTHAALCGHFAKFPGEAVGMFTDKRSVGFSGAEMDSAEHSHWYHFLSSVPSTEIPAGSIRLIPTTISGADLHATDYNVINVCPVVRYYDADGVRRVVVCHGYGIRLVKDGMSFWPSAASVSTPTS